jgi:hypothetical protein
VPASKDGFAARLFGVARRQQKPIVVDPAEVHDIPIVETGDRLTFARLQVDYFEIVPALQPFDHGQEPAVGRETHGTELRPLEQGFDRDFRAMSLGTPSDQNRDDPKEQAPGRGRRPRDPTARDGRHGNERMRHESRPRLEVRERVTCGDRYSA